MKIECFNDFVTALLDAGFSLGGGNDEGIFSLSNHFGENICSHTGVADTDPWEWRMRVLEECDDIAYAKLFWNKSGWITKQWYPYFLAIRRGNMNLYDEYFGGNISTHAKQIYDIVSTNETIAFDVIKKLGAFSKEDNSKFERALIELQRKMYLTMCGRQQKMGKDGKLFGWSSTMFCTTEHFWGNDIFEKASKIDKPEAIEKLTAQISHLNPKASSKKITKFIAG